MDLPGRLNPEGYRVPPQLRPWLVAVVGGAALAALFPAAAADVVTFTSLNLFAMAPIILIAVGLAGYVRASGADGLMARVFEGRVATMVVVAALFGAITPICGVGVLPIIAGLLAAGVPLAPIMAFWLSSPITDPAMLAITAGTLGPAFAIGKTLAAVAIGVLGGGATGLALRAGFFANPLKTNQAAAGCADSWPVLWRFWREPARRRAFVKDARSAGLTMLKWLSLAFALEGLLRDYLPAELIAGYVGGDSAWAIAIAVGIGTPIYLDGYAALPLVRGLIDLGMSPGAAMAFLVSGGITSAYASVAVFALVRWPLFVWYLVLAVVGSTLAGYVYQSIAG